MLVSLDLLISPLRKLLVCAAPALLCTALTAQTPGFVSFDAPDAGTGAHQGTFVNDINESHVVTGYYVDSTTSHGYIRSSSGVITEFDVPGSFYTSPSAISSTGQVIGTFLTNAQTGNHAFLRTPSGHFVSIDVPGATDTDAGGFSSTGQIIGVFETSSRGGWQAFLRDSNGVFHTFRDPNAGTDGGQGTFPAAINDSGEIVGSYADITGKFHGFIRDTSGNITDFDASGAGNIGTFLTSVNSNGEIVGGYYDNNPLQHALIRDAGTVAGIITKGALTGAFQRDSAGNFSPILIPIPSNTVYASDLTRDGTILGSYIDASQVSHGFVKQ